MNAKRQKRSPEAAISGERQGGGSHCQSRTRRSRRTRRWRIHCQSRTRWSRYQTRRIRRLPGKGRFVLQSSSKPQKGIVAWVEIDGVKAADWPVGGDQVLVDNVMPGNRQVTVYSIPKGGKRLTIYNKQVTVGVRNETLRIRRWPVIASRRAPKLCDVDRTCCYPRK